MSFPKFKKGDVVRIVGNCCCYGFNIGEKAVLISDGFPNERYNYWYTARSVENEDKWNVYEFDIEAIKETTVEDIICDFSNAKVGDKVYSRCYGFGEIDNINCTRTYPILVAFPPSKEQICFTITGKHNKNNVEPTLFFVDGDNKYCTKRPVHYVPADKVPIDTEVFCKNKGYDNWSNRHYCGPDNPMHCFVDGMTSFTTKNKHHWSTIVLAEPLTIDGIQYNIGDELK